MNLNNIDLNKIKVFHSVVKNGGYQLAGEELGLTRSAISQAMTTLETQLGTSLFQRKGRKLFPTAEALELSNEFETYQKSLLSALHKVKHGHQQVEGTIRVGSYYEFAKSQLSPLIKEYCDLRPHTNFRFVFDSPSKLQELISQGKIDMSFSIFPHQGSDNIQSIKVFQQELVLIAPKNLEKKTFSLDTLTETPLIEYYHSHRLVPRWVRTHFGRKRPKLNPKIYAASAEMLIQFVELGLGVGVAPLYLLSGNSNIKIIRPTPNKLIDHIWLNQFSEQFENSAHRDFYLFIRDNMI